MESGRQLNHLVVFNSGQPVGAFTYNLRNQSGETVVSEEVQIAENQLSYLITIPSSLNVLSRDLFEKMTLEWNYSTANEFVSDLLEYRLTIAIPFGVSRDSVRNLLGVNKQELQDDDIDLLAGYISFIDFLPEGTDLSELEAQGDAAAYNISTAIEAAAALKLLPSIQIRLPRIYNSGTSEFQRWNNIDWEGLKMSLNQKVVDGLDAIDPSLSLLDNITIFSLSDADTDPITGA